MKTIVNINIDSNSINENTASKVIEFLKELNELAETQGLTIVAPSKPASSSAKDEDTKGPRELQWLAHTNRKFMRHTDKTLTREQQAEKFLKDDGVVLDAEPIDATNPDVPVTEDTPSDNSEVVYVASNENDDEVK